MSTVGNLHFIGHPILGIIIALLWESPLEQQGTSKITGNNSFCPSPFFKGSITTLGPLDPWKPEESLSLGNVSHELTSDLMSTMTKTQKDWEVPTLGLCFRPIFQGISRYYLHKIWPNIRTTPPV